MEKFTTKKDLERIFNKEVGYYDYYDWFEDFICNVCGKIIHNEGSEEHFVSEQEFTDDGKTLNFCSKCKKLPNKIKLSKEY